MCGGGVNRNCLICIYGWRTKCSQKCVHSRETFWKLLMLAIWRYYADYFYNQQEETHELQLLSCRCFYWDPFQGQSSRSMFTWWMAWWWCNAKYSIGIASENNLAETVFSLSWRFLRFSLVYTGNWDGFMWTRNIGKRVHYFKFCWQKHRIYWFSHHERYFASTKNQWSIRDVFPSRKSEQMQIAPLMEQA